MHTRLQLTRRPLGRAAPRHVRRATSQNQPSNPAYFDSKFPLKVRESTLIPVKDGLWMVSQPFLATLEGADVRLNMVVARLDDGSLLVSAPVAPTEQCLGMLRQCGSTVSHIVLPNNAYEHTVFAPAMSSAFPDAKIWAVPGALDDKPGYFWVRQEASVLQLVASGRVQLLFEEPHPEWPAGIQVALLQDSGSILNLTEAALYFEASKAVAIVDFAFAALDKPGTLYPTPNPLLTKLSGIWDRLGAPYWVALCMSWGDSRGRLTRCVRRIWQWDMDTVLAAHLEPSLDNGRLEVARAFRFLQVPELEEYLQQQGMADVPAVPRVLAGTGAAQGARV